MTEHAPGHDPDGRGATTAPDPRLHHVGIATEDAAAAAAQYRAALGLPIAHEETVADRGLRVAFLGPGPYVELLEPIDDGADGPVARFLERAGPGLHHLAVAVPDVAAALELARAAGVDPIDESPRPGAWGHEVAFLHPDGLGGVLVELVGLDED